MASTYSTSLKLELMGTGDQTGLWGLTTNVNLGTALEQAIVGKGSAVFASDADLTLTLSNSNAAQTARAFVLHVTSSVSLTATRNLVVPTIEKPYVVSNATTGGQSIVVKTASGSGITVPNGARVFLYADGTNVVQMLTKDSVGLGNVDNTSDANKPVSTATQTALNAKQDTLVSGTNIKTVGGSSLLGSGNISVGTGDVVGPASSTDNALPRFDGATGKLIQGSGVAVDDINNVTGVASINGGQLAGMRNKIINGGCQVAQRGNVSITTPGAYQYGGADRILCTLNNFTTVSGTQSRSTATWAASGYAQNQLITTTGSGVVTFAQRLESIETVSLNSKTVTVSVKTYQDSGSALSVRIELYKATATDNFAGVTQVGSTYDSTAIASGSATSVSTQFTLGSSDGNTGLMVFVQFRGVGAVTSKNFAISEFQLEVGSVATPFEHRPYGTELALCQRYFEKSYNQANAPGVVLYADSMYFIPSSAKLCQPVQMKIVKRTTPSVTFYSPNTGATGKAANITGSSDVTVTTASVAGDGSFLIYMSSGAVAGNEYAAHWTASAEL